MSKSGSLKIVGKNIAEKDGKAKVTGSFQYAGDFSIPSMAYGKILRSPYAHARIKAIHSESAQEIPGVLGIVTYRDAPNIEWVAPYNNYKGLIMDERVRFVGDEVAAVAAVRKDIAEKAMDLISVEYDPLPSVLSIEDAILCNAPKVRAEGNRKEPSVTAWGNLDEGLNEADFVVESKMKFGSQQYAPVGTNACTAKWEGNQVTLWTATQTPSELKSIVAEAFQLPMNSVRVIAFPCSSSFGLWWVNNFMLITVLLAKKIGRPVKIELNQYESFAGVKRRHLEKSRGRIGCKETGDIVFIDVEHIIDNGAYGYKSDVGFFSCDLWGRSPHGRYVVEGVSTNLVTAGCMRGVGDVTLNAFVERLIDLAAIRLSMDPVDFRLKNHVRAGDILRKGTGYWDRVSEFRGKKRPSVCLSSEGLGECLRNGAESFSWKEKWSGWGKPYKICGSKYYGIGVGTATHCCGIALGGDVSALVRMHEDSSVTVCCSMSRHGQGSETTQAQIAAEALGISADDVKVEAGDTEVCPWSHGSISSTAAHRTGFATMQAALDAKRKILEIAGKHYFGCRSEDLELESGKILKKGEPDKWIALQELLSKPITDTGTVPTIIGEAGTCMPPADTFCRHFSAHFAEVEVDIETGQIAIVDYFATQDSGTVLNPKILESQVVGGAILGCGFALTEELIFDDKGRILNPNFVDYKVFRSSDFPIRCPVLFSKTYDPVGPFGAKGGGEGPTCAAVPAIAQAVYNAIGVWIDIPMKPEKVLRELGRI